MSEVKSITIEISIQTWKKLKIKSIEKDISLSLHVKDILERSVARKDILQTNEEN